MLTETSSSQQHFESASSSSSNFNKQQQFQQTHNMAAGQRQHEALASLFRSLSSLASANNNHQNPPQETVSLNLAPSDASPLKRPSSSITCSIQSAVAAAVMQQQHQLNPPNPTQRAQLNASHHPTVVPSAYLCDQMKPAPNYHFLDQHQQVVSGLENDVQFSMPPPAPAPPPQTTTTTTSTTMTTSSQLPSQRINYCTICNKELCNKYFMKTHMLKMHGINLEMEQQTMGPIENGDSDEQAPALNDEGRGQDGTQNQQGERDLSALSTQLVDQRNLNSSPGNKGQQKQVPRANSKSAQTAAANKAGKTSAKQATSVLNGFAGNSMGGVVCDICNKELCSKYFLKVHKQNTHGIMTDYQDAGQFVYPFAVNPLAAAAANSFMASAMPPVASVLPFPTMCFNQAASSSGQAPVGSDGCGPGCESGPSGHKKARSTGAEKTKRDHKQMRSSSNFSAHETAGSEKALEPLYRLILAQQQQKQQQQQASGFDSINQINAMMCYGAMGPFGPAAGISPAMVVEMILRNQHLFKRNNQQQVNQTGRAASRDKNNNGDSQRKGAGGGAAAAAKVNSKESNNSRYFVHYTEACPMCDRRFKSIKWLKTHMMNDHKQEVGAYMQMMMQSMCPAKSEPTPAIVQDQHHNQPNASYSMGIGAFGVGAPNTCTMLAQHHHQLDPSTRPMPPTVPFCQQQSQQPPPPAPLSTGLLQTIQSDHFSLIQNYLDQQRLVLQDQTGHNQTAINLSSPDSGQHRLATLNNLNVMKHSSSSSSSSSSRSSSSKTSPHSLGTILEDDQQMDQLDLSIKCHNSESQGCAFDNGPSEFLQAASRQAKMEINEFSDDDDDLPTRSSSRHERAASEANA